MQANRFGKRICLGYANFGKSMITNLNIHIQSKYWYHYAGKNQFLKVIIDLNERYILLIVNIAINYKNSKMII